MTREVIRFNGEPVRLVLDIPPENGVRREGKYGVDWQYTVNGNSASIYLPLAGRDALIQSGAAAGDEVAIQKLGKDRWAVEVLSDAQPEPAPAPAPAQPHRPKARPFPNAAYYNPGVPQADSPLPIVAKPKANGAQPAQAAAAAAVHHPYEERYARMFVVAAHALSLAHQQLIGEGLDLEPFNWEDVRALAIHFAISFERREERKS